MRTPPGLGPRRAGLLSLAALGIVLAATPARSQTAPPVKAPAAAAAPAAALDLAEAAARPALTPGAAVPVSVRRGETVFFRLPEGAGDLVAQTRNLARGTDTVMALVDAQGRVLDEDDDGGAEGLASRIEIGGDQAGPLFLRVGLLEDGDGRFEIVLEQAPPADPNGPARSLTEAATRPELAVGQPVSVRLAGRQEAWFRLPGGRDLVVLTRGLQRDTDTVLSLHDRNGRELAEDDDGGTENLASRIEVPGGQRRPLYVRARVLGAEGAFELVVEPDTTPAPSFPASLRQAASAAPLAVGQSVPIVLRRGQEAFFRLPEGDIAVVTRNLRRNADTVLTLLDGDGREMAEDDDGGGGLASRLEVAGSERRPIFVRARLLGEATGAFDLAVEADAPVAATFPLTREAAAAAPALTPGAAVPIRLRRGQAAFFRLAPGVQAALTRNLRDGTDTVLQLLDETGRTVAEDDDGGGGLASRLDLAAAAKGAFVLRAGVLGDGPGEFELVILPGR
jgi:hypothetical protein